jgi:uncharacterized RDD family membrane protein YckC
VSIPCFVLGFSFYSYFSSNPVWGTVWGFAISLTYFAGMGSQFGNGQTLGQRLTHVQVIRKDGSMVPLHTSVLRYLILLAPIVLDADILPSRLISGFNAILNLTVLAIGYLYVFNRPTRQSLHDLVARTFVVKVPWAGAVDAPRFWTWHWAILVAIAVASLVSAGIVAPRWMRIPAFSELNSVRMGLAGLPDVSSVDVGLHYVSSSGRPTTTTIIVSVHCQPKPTDYERTATEIAATVMKNDDHAKEVDFITVNFLEGFKVGLASFNFTHPFRHSPEEWAKLLEKSSP